jgi:hypothetical protein
MNQDSTYDNLLNQARGSAKYWIPQLCQALKEENSNNLPNEDIRDRRVKKDCTSIWQKEDTIRDALPDTRKEKCDKREWDAKILFSIKPFNNRAVEQFFFATGLQWSLIQDLENFGFEICGVRLNNNSNSVAILVEGCLHHYLQSGLYCFESYTKQSRQVQDLHDRWSAVIAVVVVLVVGR